MTFDRIKVLKDKMWYCERKENIFIIIALLFSFLITLYAQYPLLVNKYAINDDVRHAVYFYSRYQDKELFKNDYITNFYSQWSPWGLNIFYFIVSFFYDPVQFTKILPFFICGLSASYMFKIGKLLRNNITGLIASTLFVLVSWSREIFESFGTGDGESFAVLFCAMFLYYLLKNNSYKINIVLILLSLFYPPILLVSLLTYSTCLLFGFLKSKKINKNELGLFAGIVFIIILFFSLKYANGRLSLVNLDTMQKMEEFYPGGRTPVFFSSVYDRLTNYQSGLAFDYPLKFLFLAAIGIVFFLKKRALNLSYKFWCFLSASLVCFTLANIFMFKLYGPSRYVRHPLPFFLIIFVSYNLDKIFDKIESANIKSIAIFLFLAATFISFFPKIQRYFIVAVQPNLYNFLQTLPKDIYIAGHPNSLDNVPTFAKRKVFINEETSEPYYTNYYPVIKQRTYDFFNAYYSDSINQIYDFCKKYSITHIIVYKHHFSQDYLAKGMFYLNPFNGYIKNLVKNKKSFAWMDISTKKKIFEEGDVLVIDIAR